MDKYPEYAADKDIVYDTGKKMPIGIVKASTNAAGSTVNASGSAGSQVAIEVNGKTQTSGASATWSDGNYLTHLLQAAKSSLERQGTAWTA